MQARIKLRLLAASALLPAMVYPFWAASFTHSARERFAAAAGVMAQATNAAVDSTTMDGTIILMIFSKAD